MRITCIVYDNFIYGYDHEKQQISKYKIIEDEDSSIPEEALKELMEKVIEEL